MIDPAERKEVEDALIRFESAFHDVVTAIRRILILTDTVAMATKAKVVAQTAHSPKYSGEACSQCGMFMLVRTGTCLTCHGCHWTQGCG